MDKQTDTAMFIYLVGANCSFHILLPIVILKQRLFLPAAVEKCSDVVDAAAVDEVVVGLQLDPGRELERNLSNDSRFFLNHVSIYSLQ